MAKELKACPFCGSTMDGEHADSCYFTVDSKFRAAAAKNADLSLAPAVLKAWNTRAQLPSQQGASPAVTREAAEQFLASYHAEVWAAAEDDDSRVAYDEAGRSLAKAFLARFDEVHPADQVAEGGQHARDSEELRSLCAARDQYRDLSIKYGEKLSEALQLLTQCQERLDPHRDAALWSDVCAALGPKP